MSVLENVTIGITHWPHTYPRVVALEQSIRSLYKHLIGLHYVQIIVSVLPGDAIGTTRRVLNKYPEIKVAWQERHYEGGEHIQAIRDTHSRPFLMLVQDDWWLRRDLFLDRLIELMVEHEDVALVRMRWGRPEKIKRSIGQWPDFPEVDEMEIKNVYVYSDSPHIQSRLLERVVGRYAYPDFNKCYPLVHDPFWESEYNNRVKAAGEKGKLRVAILQETEVGKTPYWGHIGTPSGTRSTVILKDSELSDDTTGKAVAYSLPQDTKVS